jgi:uncharacterized membrane protein YgcG
MGVLRLPTICFGLIVFAASVAPAHAQDAAAPAHLAFVDGTATVERDGEVQQADSGVPFLPGDRLRTTAGRVEAIFPDGTSLAVDEYSSVDLQADTLVRITGGRILLLIPGAANPSGAARYQVDTPTGSVFTDGPGEYRVALFSGPIGLEAELAVLRGSASLSTERGTVALRAGERSIARDNEAPGRPQLFNSARFDAFDRWAAVRREARVGVASARHLPRELQMYGGVFDRYGAWQQDPAYGYVWYPTVAATWRPYYDGYWASYPRYGWTWTGGGVWAWPTHHYGRWGHVRNRWFWIPDRRWAPAWVSWASAPGYVSWCPLGFDNRPVFALSVNVGNPWAGWVVFPRRHFGGKGYYVNRYAVPGHRVPRATPFVVHASAPITPPRGPRGIAVPRGAQAGTAVPRAGVKGNAAPAADTSPMYRIRGAQPAGENRAEMRRPDAIRPGVPAAPMKAAPEAPDTTRDRTFRQPLADVQRAVPRDPAAGRPKGMPTPPAPDATPPGATPSPTFERRPYPERAQRLADPAPTTGDSRWRSPAKRAPETRRAMPDSPAATAPSPGIAMPAGPGYRERAPRAPVYAAPPSAPPQQAQPRGGDGGGAAAGGGKASGGGGGGAKGGGGGDKGAARSK